MAACLKRRIENPNLLDCRSLQSSLKRVRLNCSPGELRLQRDLKFLSMEHNWNQINERCWSFANDEEGDSNIQLHLADSLKLVLQYSETGRIWIQIPRMYPHQPPVITRIEGLWMERIMVHVVAPDASVRNEETSVRGCRNTVVFPHWSPVMNIGTLLEFCIATARAHPAPTTTALPSTSLEESKTYQEQEERMEVSHPFKFTSAFLPNRMDVGFEKYQTMQHQHLHQQSSMEL
jgi:hypothetical protein